MKNIVYKFVKDWLGRIKISKVKTLTVQFLLMKALINKKISIWKEKFKIECLII
jgi:hypothetical protein